MAATRIVRVITEVAALDRPFDYLVTDPELHLDVGDRVRVNLHNRSLRGWIWSIEADPSETPGDDPESERELKAITKWLGRGPAPSMRGVIDFAARRWCAPRARFLLAATPDHIVSELPEPPRAGDLDANVSAAALSMAPGVVRLAPTIDPLGLVLHAYQETRDRGSLLVLVPTDAWAQRLGGRLAQRGVPVAMSHQWERARAGWPLVIGARGAAFAPVPTVAGAVVIDGDDESYRSTASPTWHAVDVVIERCREASAPYWVTSPLPSPSLRFGRSVSVAPDELGHWPAIDIVDRRRLDPHDGVLSSSTLDAAHRALGGTEQVAVAVILQRLGRGRLFACVRCGELARCEWCSLAEVEHDGQLECPSHHVPRAMFCRACGSTKLRRVRSGVSTLARDVAAQLSTPVSEITSATDATTVPERVVVGTEAVFSRVRRAALVVFVDIDQYLLAPRERARRDAVLAVAKAGRLVGSRREGRGRVVIQTRRGDDTVMTAMATISFEDIMAAEDLDAEMLGLPPYGALAEVSGEGATAFVESINRNAVRVSSTDDGYVLHASSVDELTRAVSSATRTPGRLRVAVQ